jgi:hypothetical protein
MGLIFLSAILLYLTLLVVAPFVGYLLAAKRGMSQGQRRWAATAGFLVVFLPLFWDWVPTVWAFSYYCDNFAGLTVNKTPEQWIHENPGIAETLVRQSPPQEIGSEDDRYLQLNQRFRWRTRNERKPLTIVLHEQSVVDGQTGEVLVRYVDFATKRSVGSIQNLRDVKLWINRNSCMPPGGQSDGGVRFGQLLRVFEDLGVQK